MEPDLVSVIIPTYNRAVFLDDAIKSVLSQDYSHYELLILDNCSNDNTADIVGQYKDLRIKYIRHKCNIGASANWSYGIHWASGKYLCVLGDDDMFYPDFISSRLETFKKFSFAQAVFSNYDICDSTGDVIETFPIVTENESVLVDKELVKWALNGWFIGSTLYRSSIVKNLFNLGLMAGKALDTSLNLNIAIQGYKAIWINNKSLKYRRHQEQDTLNNTSQVLIGHIMACSIPLLNNPNLSYKRILLSGSAGALSSLAQSNWEKGDFIMAKRMCKLELLTNIFRLRTWIKYLRYSIPVQRFRKR